MSGAVFRSLDQEALDVLFEEARTYKRWSSRGVSDAEIKRLYDLVKFGPTSANCSPARFVFVRSSEGKARLKPLMDAGNLEATMAAPVTVIVGHDLKFYEKLKQLFPHVPDADGWFKHDPVKVRETAFRSGTLQGGYLIMAARALGLSCGPMSGFDAAGVQKEFFPEGSVEVNFLINVGYGDPAGLHPRLPRLGFEDACKML